MLDLCIKFLLPESYQINNLLTLLASVRLVAAALSCSLRCGGGAFGEGEKRAGPLKSGIAPLTSRFKYSLGRLHNHWQISATFRAKNYSTCDDISVRWATSYPTKDYSMSYESTVHTSRGRLLMNGAECLPADYFHTFHTELSLSACMSVSKFASTRLTPITNASHA